MNPMKYRPAFKDYRLWCLLLALAAMLALFARPVAVKRHPVYNFIFIVDITRSMNAADYRADGREISRLEYVKEILGELITKLPCQSRVGLGLFTERRSTLLFEPLEVCSSYAEIAESLGRIDWRMAWAADSNIAKGLMSTMEMLETSGSTVVFITDGQEAPPVNPAYQPDFSGLKSRMKGLIIGAGGLQPVPIPKFDANGERIGVYSEEDVPHRSTFGQSNLDPSQIEGYDARNAPFGSRKVTGREHLAVLHEAYLQKLAGEAGLGYVRLKDLQSLQTALQTPELATLKNVQADVRWQAALSALMLLSLVYLPNPAGLVRRLRYSGH
jgi:mxaL protein